MIGKTRVETPNYSQNVYPVLFCNPLSSNRPNYMPFFNGVLNFTVYQRLMSITKALNNVIYTAYFIIRYGHENFSNIKGKGRWTLGKIR